MVSRSVAAAGLSLVLCVFGCGDSSGAGSSGAASASAAPPDPGAAPASGEETSFPTLGVALRLPAGAKGTAQEAAIQVEGASGISVQVLVRDELSEIGTFEQQVSDVDLLAKMSQAKEPPTWAQKTKGADGAWILEYDLRRADGTVAHSVNVSYVVGKKAVGCAYTGSSDPQIREAVVLCKAMAPRAL